MVKKLRVLKNFMFYPPIRLSPLLRRLLQVFVWLRASDLKQETEKGSKKIRQSAQRNGHLRAFPKEPPTYLLRFLAVFLCSITDKSVGTNRNPLNDVGYGKRN